MAEIPSSPPQNPPGTLWKPIGITLLTTFLLALTTCAGGINLGKDRGYILLYAGLLFIGLFLLTLFFAIVYFIVWLIQNAGSK
jgi:hypothetical protein